MGCAFQVLRSETRSPRREGEGRDATMANVTAITAITAITATILCQPTLRLAIASVHEFLPSADIHAFVPESVRRTCAPLAEISKVTWYNLVPAHPEVRSQYDPSYWYSVFMTDETLWNAIATPLVLVFQADTLLCRPIDLARFVEARYDYLGGPSLQYDGRTTPVPWQNLQQTLGSFLNGGIALHRREWTARCARTLAHAQLNEDAKWNRCGFTPVSALDAMSFGSDNGFILCFGHKGRRVCPSTVHKPWSRQRGRRLHELWRHCPRLEQMQHEWTRFK